MKMLDLGDVQLHYRVDGPDDGAPLVFSNSLGTDFRLWDPILPLLPEGLRIIRYDKRGHGLSSCPKSPYSMGSLVSDLERLLDHLAVQNAMVVGLSIGGLIVQGLAVKRLDQVRAIVLSNTGAKIGTRDIWNDRIATAQAQGVEALADATMERWFSADFMNTPELALWRNMFCRTPLDGYAGCGHAIAGSDFYTTTASLRLPAMGIAGSEDGGTPPDLVRETTELIPGSRFELIRGAGHLPCVEKPDLYAGLLTDFLTQTGHI